MLDAVHHVIIDGHVVTQVTAVPAAVAAVRHQVRDVKGGFKKLKVLECESVVISNSFQKK